MVEIVWEFHVAPGKEEEFEQHYGPQGTWVQLFRKAKEFVRTDLLRDPEIRGRYLTVDCWTTLGAYDAFKQNFAAEYKTIDAQMEALTQGETKVGVFETV